MSAAREKDSADFDLEAFIELFDEALTSDDPSVQKTLQHLMVICALARNHDNHAVRQGPLRRMFEDQKHILQRLSNLEMQHQQKQNLWPSNPGLGTPPGSTPIPGVYPHTYPGPNVIWTQTTPGTTWGGTLGGGGPPTAVAQSTTGQSTTSYAWDPAQGAAVAKKINSPGFKKIVERVDDLLKDEKYKGSSLSAIKQKDEL